MNEKQLQQHLHDIAQEDVPDVDLWDQINEQIDTPSSPSRLHVLKPLLRGVATVAVMLFITAAGYAAYQEFRGGMDPSLPQEDITELNIQQTVDDITATLIWGYADEFRGSVSHQVTYDPNTQTLGGLASQEIRLADGTVLSRPSGVGGGGGGGGGSNTRSTGTILPFDTTIITGDPDTIDLVYTVTYGGENAPPPMRPPSAAAPANGQGGGGGGGNGASPAQHTDPAPERTFTFEFTLPLLDAFELDRTQEASDRGITFTTRSVRIAPSMTKFELCHTGLDPLADTAGSWAVETRIGNTVYNRVPFFRASDDAPPQPLPSEAGCYDGQVQIPYEDDPDTLVIRPVFLQPVPITEANARAIEADFAEKGIALSVDIFQNSENPRQVGLGFGIEVDRENSPGLAELDDTEEYTLISGYPYFQNELDADWSMTFELP